MYTSHIILVISLLIFTSYSSWPSWEDLAHLHSLPKGLFTRYPQGPDGGSKCLASTHRPELGFFIFIRRQFLRRWYFKNPICSTGGCSWQPKRCCELYDEMEAKNQGPLKIWTPNRSSCFFIVSLVSSSILFVVISFFVCSFQQQKNLHVAPWPTSWPPVGPATNSSLSMDRPERTGPTSNMAEGNPAEDPNVPHFSVEVFEFFDPSGKISMKNPRLHGEISKNPSGIWTLNHSSVFVEKKTVFPGLHKRGERHGLPGISQNRLLNLLHLQLRFLWETRSSIKISPIIPIIPHTYPAYPPLLFWEFLRESALSDQSVDLTFPWPTSATSRRQCKSITQKPG